MPWLYRVTVNLSYSWLSRGKRRRSSDLIDHLVSPMGHAPDRVAEQVEMRQQVREAIAALSIDQRVVIVLYYLNNLSLQDIAEILDLPVGTVKSRLYYARENLRRKLGSNLAWLPEVAHGYL